MSKAVFEVPNNEEGRAFIRLMSKFLNRNEYNWKRFCRGKRKGLPLYKLSKKALNHEELRVPYADSWSVYLKDKDRRGFRV